MILEKISQKTLTVSVIGLGYVGLPLAMCFAEKGFQTYGLDIDNRKIDLLSKRKSYLKHIHEEQVKKLMETNYFKGSTDFRILKEVDAVIICVPTPLDEHREPDLSYIVKTIDEIIPYLHKGQIISLESTTYPGTTEEVVRPRIEEVGLEIGKDFFLVFSPEREDPGNKDFSTTNIPKVVGGTTERCLERGVALYGAIIDKIIPVGSTQTAEMTKLLENIYRAVNIGLVNEMKIVADKMGIDIWEVIQAASSKPFGFHAFYPGPGWGGHCIPIDPFYLTWKAREYGVNTRFIELAGEVNTAMPSWIIEKVAEGLNHQCKSLKKSKVLLIGIAYKKNVDDMRESPAFELIRLLKSREAEVFYYDPYIPVFPKIRKYRYAMQSIELKQELIETMDCVLIVTDHDEIDYDLIQKNAKLIIDSRGRYSRIHKNVIRC